jgi:Cof subfamily protein (haloacid dehalogenase superfamily)
LAHHAKNKVLSVSRVDGGPKRWILSIVNRLVTIRNVIKLLAIDLDGTTVQHDNEISSRVIQTVAAARDAGVRVVIATGRNVIGVKHFAERLGLGGPMIAQQGGLIYDVSTNATLRRLSLERELACELVALERVYPSWNTVLYMGKQIFVTNGEYFARRNNLVGFAPITVPDLCAVMDSSDPDKVLYMMEPHETPSVLTWMIDHVGPRATVVQSHAQFVEVNPLGADKGAGLAWLCAQLGIAQEETMAIGDQHNDSTMLAWAGLSIAMGNAGAELQALADWVAPSVEDDGAAVAIDKFILT